MTYEKFLVGCKEMIRARLGKESLTRAEFAAACSTDEKKYTAAYLRNIEEGYQKPGRDLLEAAARAAGFDFEDSLRLPIKLPVPTRKQAAVTVFMKAIDDWRSEQAIDAAMALLTYRKPRRPKTGGRTRKPQGSAA